MQLIYILFLTLLFDISYANDEVSKTSPPAWVNTINPSDKKIIEGNGSYQYLLIDIQDNLKSQAVYRHYVVKVLNSEGVQSMSDISITFDPTYQKLHFHDIKIVRGENILSKLQESEIQTFQRETSMERSLYDGSISAVINLTDVRENDIIEYSYSIVGFNPINEGNYATTFYHQYTIPVNRVYNRVLTSPKNDIQFRLYEGASKPVVKKSNELSEYIWDVNAIDYKLYDSNVPAWFDPHKRVSISTFNDWKDVVDWALPLYKYSEWEIAEIKQSLNDSYSKETKILELIRLVQDDIRYLGFESGIGAYKPNQPLKVFNQRYGDCKDKSLLLVSLLRSEGVSANPLLVNTQLKGEIKNQLPSNGVFDHCVVYFNYEGADYFVDPTISNQGGSIQKISFPNYQSGLLLKQGNTQLLTIPKNNKPALDIKELITVDSIGSSAGLMIRSEYTGSKADYIRTYFNTNSRESIQKEYLNYYSNLYPDIESVDEIKFYDYDRNSSNKVIIEEYYRVKNFWFNSEDQSYIYCHIYPLVLESQINYAKTTGHDMPYYMGVPHRFSQTTQVDLPEEWSVQETNESVIGDGFAYENIIKGYGKTVSITHKYDLNKEYISGASVESMLRKHEDIKNELSYYLTYNQSLSGFELSWISVILASIAFGAGIFFSLRIYRNFDPDAWIYAEDKPIGSWLILPAIGLTLSPIILCTRIFTAEHFNQNTWQSIFSSEIDQSVNVVLLIGAEIIYNFLFLAFTILVLVVFYKRRTSAPRLISIYFLISFLGPLIDLLLVEEFLPGQFSQSENMATYKDLGRSFIAAAIWIPYFNISERAKSTFCKRINGSDSI